MPEGNDGSCEWSVNGTPLSEHQRDVEAPFIKMNVLLKQTGRSKLGNVTPFKCQSSRIIDLCSSLKYGTGSPSGNRNMSAATGDDPQALFLHAFHTVKNCHWLLSGYVVFAVQWDYISGLMHNEWLKQCI